MGEIKSNKQRKGEFRAIRRKRRTDAQTAAKPNPNPTPPGSVPCDPSLLKPFNSYGVPHFVARGYYLDIEFICRDCGKYEIWKAAQQKWWHETAKGNVESRAIRCRACRKIEHGRKELARKAQQVGFIKEGQSN